MKSYFAPQQFCLVGKAWEVQYYLRKLVATSPRLGQTLVSLLNEKGIPSPTRKFNPFTLVSSKEV
jgi:hypothetical protein